MSISYIIVCIQITYVLTLIPSVGEYHFRSLDFFGAIVMTILGYEELYKSHISDLVFLGHEGVILPDL